MRTRLAVVPNGPKRVGLIVLCAAVAVAGVVLVTGRGQPGFILTLRNVPSGGEIYVDGRPRGYTREEGTITVAFLSPGQHEVIVLSQCLEVSVPDVSGKDGEVVSREVDLTTVAAPLPKRITHGTKDPSPMVLVPAGQFIMGSEDTVNNTLLVNNPLRIEHLDDYFIDEYEVTNEQYKKFCDETRRQAPRPAWNPQYFTDYPKAPVVGVSWEDAVAYAKWAGKILPSDAQWEKAASWNPAAKDADPKWKRRYPWGNEADASRANIGQKNPRPVEIDKSAGDISAYEVQAMAGNVAEWVDAGNSSGGGSSLGADERMYKGVSYVAPDIRDAMTTRSNKASATLSREELAESRVGFRCAVWARDHKSQQARCP